MYNRERFNLTQLKNSLLSYNANLLKLGISPDETEISLPAVAWDNLNRMLVSGSAPAATKFFQPISTDKFKLSGILVKRKEVQL